MMYVWNSILLKEEENRGMEKIGESNDIPCYPLAALFTYIKWWGFVSQGNRECGIYTHLPK